MSITRTPNGIDRPWFHYGKAFGALALVLLGFASLCALIWAALSGI